MTINSILRNTQYILIWHILSKFLGISEMYLEPSHSWEPLTSFAKSNTLDVWLSPEYASVFILFSQQIPMKTQMALFRFLDFWPDFVYTKFAIILDVRGVSRTFANIKDGGFATKVSSFLAVNYCWKVLHLRYLWMFWIRFWITYWHEI